MIKYNNSNINDWYFYTSDIIKVYRNNAVCYYKIATSGGTSGQTPCFYELINGEYILDTYTGSNHGTLTLGPAV